MGGQGVGDPFEGDSSVGHEAGRSVAWQVRVDVTEPGVVSDPLRDRWTLEGPSGPPVSLVKTRFRSLCQWRPATLWVLCWMSRWRASASTQARGLGRSARVRWLLGVFGATSISRPESRRRLRATVSVGGFGNPTVSCGDAGRPSPPISSASGVDLGGVRSYSR